MKITMSHEVQRMKIAGSKFCLQALLGRVLQVFGFDARTAAPSLLDLLYFLIKVQLKGSFGICDDNKNSKRLLKWKHGT